MTNSPAEKCGAVVGDDAAPEWCSYDDAVDWLRAARGLSEGAARNQADQAIASGNVQRRGRWKHQLREREQFGQDFVPIVGALDDVFFAYTFLTDIELNFADFCAQVELQIGSPALPERPKARERYLPWLASVVRKHPDLPSRELAIHARRQADALRKAGKNDPDLPKQRRSIVEAVERIRRRAQISAT
jgi:hypothetical protein